MCKTTKSSTTKAAAVTKGAHNHAAEAKNYKVPAVRKTPEGYHRGTEVEFDPTRVPAPILHALYGPRFVLGEKYIVISVFQKEANQKDFVEVTVRDAAGDCYGYIASHHLKKFGAANRAASKVNDPALRPLGLLRPGVLDTGAQHLNGIVEVSINGVTVGYVNARTEDEARELANKKFGPDAVVPTICTTEAKTEVDLSDQETDMGVTDETPEDVTPNPAPEPDAKAKKVGAKAAPKKAADSAYYPSLSERIAERGRIAREEEAKAKAKPTDV